MCGMSIKSISNLGSAAVNGIVRKIPSATINNEKVLKTIKWTADHLAAPHNNRLILGITAILIQPLIDLYNRNVDEKTRKTSVARTLAKIIAGTTTGYFIRYACFKGIEYMTKDPAKAVQKLNSTIFPKGLSFLKKMESALYPKGIANVTIEGLKNHKNAISTFAGLGIMLFTNFLIDAPFTKYLTNKFIKRIDNTNRNTNPILNPYFTRPTMDTFTAKTSKGAA